MKEFKEYLPLEVFKEMIKDDENNANSTEKNLPVLYEALDKFLVENNLIYPLANSEHTRTNFEYDWNNYKNKKHTDLEVFRPIISKYFYMKIWKTEDVEKSYEDLNQKINKGNFLPFDLEDNYFDFESGINLKMMIKNWVPHFMTYTPGATWKELGKFDIFEPKKIEKVAEKQIEFKTGNLLVADWFKIKEFTELVVKIIVLKLIQKKGALSSLFII